MARKLKVGIEITVMNRVGASFQEQLDVAALAEDVGLDFWGIPLNQGASRTDESLAVIKRLWTEPAVTHEGKYYKFTDFPLEPKPVQKPHPPIWIGGASGAAPRCGGGYWGGLG